MPWPERQRKAIFLDVKRRKGEQAARRLMREAGYGKQASPVGQDFRARLRRHKGRKGRLRVG